jgi:GTP-binding protein
MDLQEARDKLPALRERAEAEDLQVMAISSATSDGVQDLMNLTARRLREIQEDEAYRRKVEAVTTATAGPVLRPEPEDAFSVEEVEDGFLVTGKRIERMVAMTNPESAEGMVRLERQLRRMGVMDALEKAGVMPGDHVHFGTKTEMIWGEEM